MAIMDRIRARYDDLALRYAKLSKKSRFLLWTWVTIQWILLIVFIWVTPKKIFEGLAAWANDLRETKGGFLLLIGFITLTSFPPLFGFSTACTLCGFAYGISKGFLIAFCGMLCGAMCSFLFARLFFSAYAHKMLQHSTFFKAFGSAIKHRGVPLLCLLRLTPLPWAYANFSLATFKEITPIHFLIATCAYSPKLLLHVYIGTRLYLFSDPDHLHDMDSTTKWLNSLSIVASVLLGVAVGSYAYRLMAGYAARGEVALGDEEDLDRFLEQEEELERQEEASAASAPAGPGRSAGTGRIDRPARIGRTLSGSSSAGSSTAGDDGDATLDLRSESPDAVELSSQHRPIRV